MFDIGFWELAVIGVVALLVIGPERLPKVARTAGLWFGKARYFIGSVKADIEKELRAEELKRILDEQARSSGLHEILEETKSSLDSARADLSSARAGLESLEARQPETADAHKPEPSSALPEPTEPRHDR
jgi:sec-independent protein translocase protein TatB